MFQCFSLRWLAALGSAAVLTVSAQSAPQVPAPASPASQAQAAPYRSTLDGYQAFSDEKVLPWKQANDVVEKRGGWRAYAKEAQGAPSRTDPAPRGDSTKPTPNANHKGKP